MRYRTRPAAIGREAVDADPIAVRRRIAAETTAEIFGDPGTLALYSSDASNYRVLPTLVAAPRTATDLTGILAICHDVRMPVTLRGGGTSVAGNACGPGVVIDTSRHLTAILDLDAEGRQVTVEPGAICESINRVLAHHGLRLGPDPSSGDRCTIGGMIGNNACGSRSVRWGTTAEAVRALDLALADGRNLEVSSQPFSAQSDPILTQIARLVDRHGAQIRNELPEWSRRVSGYALDYLLPERGANLAAALVGSEGTCAVVRAATLELVPIPPECTLLVLGFPDDVAAARAVPSLLTEQPLTVEGISAGLFTPDERQKMAQLLPDGSAWLLVEAEGPTPSAARRHAERLAAAAAEFGSGLIVDDPAARAALWKLRQEGAGRATRLPNGSEAWPGLEDAVVPPDQLADYLTRFHQLMATHGLEGSTFGHFGEGCLHVRIGFDLASTAGVERFGRFMHEAADLIVRHHGSISGEHGDGRARSALLERMYSPAMLAAFREFKAIWDPHSLLNPGILVDPAPMDAGLRQAAPTGIELQTFLEFGKSDGNFRNAVQRCVGVGACVSRTYNTLMCPSYQATGIERDSTRGRSRVLQEMIAGDLAHEGWRSSAVREALDMCLACKGCLSDCPTGVDMAAYKAEFLSHHYQGRLRPRSHYSVGRLPTWLRVGARAPRLVNVLMRHAPRLVGTIAGILTDRPIPALAPIPFARSHRKTSAPPATAGIVLWPDTFNNHFTPAVLDAGVSVLEANGMSVRLPGGPVCCALTRITTGQLDGARRVLRRALRFLDDETDPVVVLEPSCAAALRHDLPRILPDDPKAHRLAARIATLAEVLDATGFKPAGPPLPNPLVQPHCHQQAVLGTDPDRRILELTGADDPEMLIGCCGLAGNFGIEPNHREVADAVAALHLLPALERAGLDTPVLADGFSCRTQIAWLTGRRAMHLAEVLAERLVGDQNGDITNP